MKFSIVCPTRDRFKRVQQLIGSIENTVADLDAVELILGADFNDPSIHDIQAMLRDTSFVVKLFVGQHETINGKWWNRLLPLATGDILCPFSDDAIFEEPGWNLLIESEVVRFPDQIVMVYGDDGIMGEKLATGSFVTRRWVEVLGTLCPEYFEVDWIDTWTHDIAKMIGRSVYIPQILYRHLHVRLGDKWDDKTYQLQAKVRGQKMWEQHVAYYKSLEPERRKWAQKLWDAINEKN